jgi:YHS domain-containing protein
MKNAAFPTIGMLVLVTACTQSPPPAPSTTAPSPAVHAESTPRNTQTAPTSALTRVKDPSLVCMVNNQFMGTPQIPVTVNGNTYYGCCEMCKGRLANDPSARTAVDPVSQRPVDKASAIIGRADNGAALYFESEQTFAAYSPQKHAK